MKKLSLRPYHGKVWVCPTIEKMEKVYVKLCKQPWPHGYTDPTGGRYVKIEYGKPADTKWLVFASNPGALAHELSHVLLKTFGSVGHNPTEGDGEPFCYMLSQLMLEAK